MINLTQPEKAGVCSSRLERISPALQAYIDKKQLAGMVALLARRGQPVYFKNFGYAHLEAGALMQPDTIFRIYSMSKPITSVAVMLLLEEGRLHINTPVSTLIPGFKDLKVLVEANNAGALERLKTDITIHHLLTHTAGLGYGHKKNNYIDLLFRQRIHRHDEEAARTSYEDLMQRITSIPLVFQPGQAWRYSIASDVLAYVVELVSGKPFARFLQERIFDPLGMVDTGFSVADSQLNRFSANYGPAQDGNLQVIDAPQTSVYRLSPLGPSGSGGLVSTAPDYLRFCQMLLNKGELDGTRLLGRKTVEWMTMNHLPNNGRIDDPAQGFGLGFAVIVEPALYPMLASTGTYQWSGAANTRFWIDPQEELIGILMLQYMPSDTYPVHQDFQNLAYQAIID